MYTLTEKKTTNNIKFARYVLINSLSDFIFTSIRFLYQNNVSYMENDSRNVKYEYEIFWKRILLVDGEDDISDADRNNQIFKNTLTSAKSLKETYAEWRSK